MALPQKKRGFRKIIINGETFNWRLDSQIEICPASFKDNKLFVDFGWFDPWLSINDKSNIQGRQKLSIITPGFIRKVIEFSLLHNWDITRKTGITKVQYRDNQFNIVL